MIMPPRYTGGVEEIMRTVMEGGRLERTTFFYLMLHGAYPGCGMHSATSK
jgi:hypothetical protein